MKKIFCFVVRKIERFFRCSHLLNPSHHHMLGQDYFEKRLGDIYQYSIIPYLSGIGECISSKKKYWWELCIDISGNIIFVLYPREGGDFLANPHQEIKSFSGISLDGEWEIDCQNICWLSTLYKNKITSLFYLPNLVCLKKKTTDIQPVAKPNKAKAYLSNFLLSSPKQLSLKINTKELCFEMLKNSRSICELIDIGRIDNAILSQVIIPINPNEDIKDIEEEAKSISWFLSFLSLNDNCIPIIEYLSDDKTVEFKIENNYKQKFKRKDFIVYDSEVDVGISISSAFANCYAKYKSMQNFIEINKFITFLVKINQHDIIEVKWALLLMAYEYFLTKYLINVVGSLKRENAQETNIQNKLQMINTELRFIPKDMMNNILPTKIRNPLFHQGEIVLMDTQEKIKHFKKYYDLLVIIVLKVLGYSGRYRLYCGEYRSL